MKEYSEKNQNRIDSNMDFWKDAQEFLKTQLPKDYQVKLKEYAKNKGYNRNEFMLFKIMLEESLRLYSTCVLLMNYTDDNNIK